jgi:hypothetical protein
VWFHADNLVLNLAQALCVALPAAGLPVFLQRARRGAWALVLPLSIIVCVAVISLVPASTQVYTWAALIGVPAGAALALGWAAHGARPWLALLAVPLFAVAWAADGSYAGQAAADVLILGSAVTLGRLLAAAGPLAIVKVALIAMAAVDAYLVFGGTLSAPSAALNAATPSAGLPSLQTGTFGNSSLGYGDFLAAGVLGGVLAIERAPQWWLAGALLAVSYAWDQLFLVTDLLPATVPPAIVLLGVEGARAWRRRQPARRPALDHP